MTVFLVPNLKKERAVPTTQAAIAALCQYGVFILMEHAMSTAFSKENVRFVTRSEALAQCDVILTVGGDGTMLHMARESLAALKPLLGVNVGHTGFLATVEAYELDKLERLAKGNYTLDSRDVLRVPFHNEVRTALNDVVIAKTAVSQTLEMQILCDGIPVNRYRGDGVIIATPTGSTAYSLSAGGPVLDAHIHGIVVTPICAHALHNPPMVFSAARRLQVRILSPGDVSAVISFDGCGDEAIERQDAIEISFSDKHVLLVSFNEADQFEAIDKKLKGR